MSVARVLALLVVLSACPRSDSDTVDCATQPDRCGPNSTCSGMPGAASCICNPGYNDEGSGCVDIDECLPGVNPCSADASCSNTAGSFSCACNAGFAGDGMTCSDIDECAEHTDSCSPTATCSNLPGSFTCACNQGYAGDGVTCADVDECAAHSDDCSADATCVNVPGSFFCTCGRGFTGDGVTCADIDECAMHLDDCGANAICNNTPGSFRCSCSAGYTGDGITCVDIDECATHTDDCSPDATCRNTLGGFTCTCNAGTRGDGVNCYALDDFCRIVNPGYPLCAGLPSLPQTVVSNLQTYVVIGRAEPGDTVTVTLNGTAIAGVTFQNGPDGFRDFMAVVPLAPGANRVDVAWQTFAFGTLTTSRVIVRDDAHVTSRLIYLDVQSAALDGTWVLDRDQGDAPIGVLDGHIAAIAQDHSELYMTDLSVLDVATHHVRRTLPGQMAGLTRTNTVVSQDGRFIYTASIGVDIASNAVVRVLPVRIAMQNVVSLGGPAISSDGRYIFFGNPVQRLDLATDLVAPVGISWPFLTDVALSPDDSLLATAMYASAAGHVSFVDAATFQLRATVPMGDFTGVIATVGDVAFCGSAGNPVLGGGGLVAVDLRSLATSRVLFQRADALAALSPAEVFVSSGPSAGIDVYSYGPGGLALTKSIFLALNRSFFRTDIRAIVLAVRPSPP